MSDIKRYAVFSGDRFYPSGGWYDYRSSYDTLDEAVEAQTSGDWRHVVDLSTGQIRVIPTHDAHVAKAVQCRMCQCESPRVDGGIHVDSERLGLSKDSPCDQVFAARDHVGWLAYVDGTPLLHDSGEVMRFSSVTRAYEVACAGAPTRWRP